ncbi:mt-a70 family protein [Anaeramoeba flamelloides]|uniref:Mt-a70 family protein n=1 Tax=Anaeramoeba flamelloides TaxID=1746091 RepID=A0ABQ8XJM4_9EUKA|nr:mt-a70 family protein [Anaeramoeba flamelloides]
MSFWLTSSDFQRDVVLAWLTFDYNQNPTHYYVEEIPQPKANVKPICKKDQKIVEQRIKKVKNKVQIKKTKHPNLNLNQLNGINNLTVAQSTILKIRNQVMNKNYMTNSLEIIQENFIAKKDQKILDKQNTKTTFLNSEEYRINNTFSTIPEFSVFIEKDITQINFRKLIEKTGRPPVLIIDPPWRIASPKSTGGLKIHYPPSLMAC